MTHQDYPLFIKRKDFRKKRLLVNDLVRGLFSSLDIGIYIWPTCRPLCTFLRPIGGAQMPQNRIKNYFWLFRTISPARMGLMIWLWAYFQTYFKHIKLFSGCFCMNFSVDYFPISKLENKPLTKSLDPFL
jgi:hypothetical protein